MTPFLNLMVLIRSIPLNKIHFVIVVKNHTRIIRKQNIVNFALLLSVQNAGIRVEFFHKVKIYLVVIAAKYVIESFS